MALDSAEVAARVAAEVPASSARGVQTASRLTLEVAPASMPEVLRFLRDDPAMACKLFVDGTAVDYEAIRGTVEVIYVVRAMADPSRCIVVKAAVDVADPVMPTSSQVYAGANWAEREIYDMYGVHFEGHPDLRRILMYPEFEGHPLRKSYPYQKRQPLVPERDPLVDPWPRRY
jgi:NADH-quinone oxidoreductase subunit C